MPSERITYSSVRLLEAFNFSLDVLKSLRWYALFRSLHANIPKFLMFLAEEDDGAAGLDMEWRRSVLDGMVDDHDNAVVGDGRFFCHGEDRPTDLDCLKEGYFVCGCHCFKGWYEM